MLKRPLLKGLHYLPLPGEDKRQKWNVIKGKERCWAKTRKLESLEVQCKAP